MRRTDLKLLVDLVVLASASLTFASGLVLLLAFHMDDGPFRASALGVTRLAWLNLHRLSSPILATGVGLHAVLNWRGLVGWLRRATSGGRRSGAGLELLLYVSFSTVVVTGLVAWLAVAGSAPLAGPVPMEDVAHLRHHLIDVHHLTGLVALALAVHHAGHRWSALRRGLSAWSARGAPRRTVREA